MRTGSRADVHATWSDGEVCGWVWSDGPTRAAPVTALYFDVFGGRSPNRLGSVAIDIPERGRLTVPCGVWSPRALVDGLLGRSASSSLSASVMWLYRAVDAAALIVGSRHVVPEFATVGGSPSAEDARWGIVRDPSVEAVIDELQETMPPVFAAAGPVDVVEVVGALVDAAARTGLRAARWRPPSEIGREPGVRWVRTVFRHLADDPSVPTRGLESVDGAAALVDWCRQERARLLGEPVVRPRLRMVPPPDVDGDWQFGLEVVAADDPSLWCTALDAITGEARAVAVAGAAHHVASLERMIVDAARVLARDVPVLEELVDDPSEPARLELEEVGVVLGLSERIAAAGVELLGPEQLLRRAVRLDARATPVPEGGISAGLDAKVLVAWNPVIDDVAVTAEDLIRAEASGASLMQVGGRWVSLDRTQVRKVLDALERHHGADEEMNAAELLGLIGSSDDIDVEIHGDDWAGELLAGLPDERLEELREPAGFVGELRHYQRRGLSWLAFLARLGLGGCLADDMGLGKTATTLAHLVARPGPHLVVCPLSVVRNWEQEAARFTPSLSVLIHHGTDRRQGDSLTGEFAAADIVITTYGLLAKDCEALSQVRWSTLVLDEAQAVKNPHTKAARAARKLPAAQRLALTGTPIENRLSELWSILDIVNPGLLGSLAKFQSNFATPIERHKDERVAEQLRRLTRPFLLRRTKADRTLLPDLPDRIEQIAWASLTREQASMYQSVVDRLLADASASSGMKRRGLVLASLTRLKQICNHPAHALGDGSRLAGRSGKLTRFDELVDELLDAEQRALVFTQYREMGDLLQRHLLERLGRRVEFLHGGVARRSRDSMIDRFQAGEGEPLIIISLKAGGAGINLTAASRVIHYDRWWNPAVEDQATDRAWRIGQSQTVFVHKLVCTGTLEERIGRLIDDKRALASSVVGATGEAWLSELSTDALRDLVTLDRSAVES